jgi:hypothetical protein
MRPNKLDRTVFKHQTIQEASHNLEYWKSQSYEKRLEAANYLNSVAYNFDTDNPPRLDKTYFKIRQRK